MDDAEVEGLQAYAQLIERLLLPRCAPSATNAPSSNSSTHSSTES